MPTLKKPFDQFTDEELEKFRFAFVRENLRRASWKWPAFGLADQKARISRGLYECKACKQVIRAKDKQRDHIRPMVDPIEGFCGWDKALPRLLCKTDEIQILCKECHQKKTGKENIERKAIRNERRKKK